MWVKGSLESGNAGSQVCPPREQQISQIQVKERRWVSRRLHNGCCYLVLCLDTLDTIAWFYLFSLGTVTWQDIVLLLLGTLLRYTWYLTPACRHLMCLTSLEQFFINWLFKPAPLSWTTCTAWDNFKQFQVASSSVKFNKFSIKIWFFLMQENVFISLAKNFEQFTFSELITEA